MYAIVTRRKMNSEREQETRERAATDFWPKLQQAPGFVSFSLIRGEDGVSTVVVVWDSQAQADAFGEEADSWFRTLEEFGHQLEARWVGEVLQHLTAQT